MTEEQYEKMNNEIHTAGGHYAFLTVNEEFNKISLFSDYEDALAMFAMLADTILSEYLPKIGYSVRYDLSSVLKQTVMLSDAKPDDETERALENLKEILTKEKGEN